MSRTLARQKLDAALSAICCAESNIDEALTQMLQGSKQDEKLAHAVLGMLSAGCGEIRKGLREAIEVIR